MAWALAITRHHCHHLALLERQAADALQQQLEATESAAPAAGGREGAEDGDAISGVTSSRPHKADLSLTQYATLVWGLAVLDHPPALLLGLFGRLMRARDARGAARAAWRAAAAAVTAPTPASAAPAASVAVGSPVANASSKRSFSALCTIAWSVAAAGDVGQCSAALPPLLQELAGAAPAVLLSLQEQPPQQHGWAGGGRPPDGAQRRRLMQLHQFALAMAQEQRLQQRKQQKPVQPLEIPAALQQLLAAATTAWAAEGQRRHGRLHASSRSPRVS